MNKYKLRMRTLTGLGNEYVYVYATSNFERYADIHKLKYVRDITKDYQLTDRFEKLQNNWNELKKWLEEESKLKGSETAYLYYGKVLKKMQELEQGKE